MKQKDLRLENPFVGYRFRLSLAAQRVAVGTLTLILGLTGVSAPRPAASTPLCARATVRPASVAVYLYNADHIAVLEPTASITEGAVFTDAGYVGTIDTANNIVDANADIVGYVAVAGPIGG